MSVIKYSAGLSAGIDDDRDEFATFGVVVVTIEECPG